MIASSSNRRHRRRRRLQLLQPRRNHDLHHGDIRRPERHQGSHARRVRRRAEARAELGERRVVAEGAAPGGAPVELAVLRGLAGARGGGGVEGVGGDEGVSVNNIVCRYGGADPKVGRAFGEGEYGVAKVVAEGALSAGLGAIENHGRRVLVDVDD